MAKTPKASVADVDDGVVNEQEEVDAGARNSAVDELIDFKPTPEILESLDNEEEGDDQVEEEDQDGIEEDSDDTPEEVVEEDSEDNEQEEGEVEPSAEERLRARIEELTAQLEGRETPPSSAPPTAQAPAQPEAASPTSQAPPTEQAPTPPAQQAPTTEPITFVTKENFVDAFRTPEGLNALLNKVYIAGQEAVTRTLPKLIEVTVQRQTALAQAVRDFYQENADLVPYQKYVGFKTREIQQREPNLAPADLLKKVAEEVRKDMALNAKAQTAEQKRRAKAGGRAPFATGGKTRKSGPREVNPNKTIADKVADLID